MIPNRSAASSQSQPPEQVGQSSYYTAPVFDIVRRDYVPSRINEGGVTDGREYQTANPIIKSEIDLGYATSIMPPGKRNASGEPNSAPVKQPKTERPEEFSKQVRSKLQGSSRTGQACDRCKVRKIRCDGLPGGCSPCLQNSTECRTTDRITGRATQRGYVEGIEQQNRALSERVQELEKRLMQSGIDVKPSNIYHDAAASNYDYNQSSSAQAPAWSPVAYAPQPGNALASQHDANAFRELPVFRAEATGDNYLGVSPGNSHLSSIKGTALSILGMTIDIADFKSDDMDEPDKSAGHHQLYNKSYQAFLQSALNINPRMEKVDLPGKDEAFMYAEWYFRVLNPFMPVLHKPTFMKLLTSWYHDPNFRATTAETVMVHMVFAIMFFQYATRNWEDPESHQRLTNLSNMHYHYSLSMFYQLSVSHTMQDVQALTMICLHLRNFPKPGASWIFTQTALSLAIELGLHRSAKKWAGENPPNLLDIEMRKRTFWCLLTIHVTVAGKLGRPMAFRFEDFDIEIPQEVDDELLSENGLDTSRPGKCLHMIGLHAMRLVPLFMEMYNTVYAVRRQPETYMSTVNSLEAKLRSWKNSCPLELQSGDEPGQDDQERRIFSLYTKTWEHEFRLLLRHPSVAGITDATFRSESMRVCVESSRGMLSAVRQLQKYKSLDTTWYQSAVYVMAITTTLFAQWEKRSELSVADLIALREEMGYWLDIMGDVGSLLGSGMRLREAVRNVTEGTLGLLNRSLPSNNAVRQSKSTPQQALPASTSTYSKPPTYSFDNTATSNVTGTSIPSYISAEGLPHQQTPYPQATQYQTYPDPGTSSNLNYTPQDTPQDTHTYTPFSASEPHDAPLLAAFATQASQVASDWQRRDSQIPNSSSQAWHQWTNTMTNSLEPQECYSANALMQLGGNTTTAEAAQTSAALSHDMATTSAGVLEQSQLAGHVQWPLNIFDIGPGGHGG